jgi:DNA-binding response OmpR family regulator
MLMQKKQGTMTMNQETNWLRILLVDDEDAFRAAVSMSLEETSRFKVDPCDSGEAAIEKLAMEVYDVVVLDYKMPKMSGLNVLQWMHEQKISTPVIMLTAAGTEHVAVEAMKLGAYDYIRKESVEIDHLPIVIQGTYERFLFKQERDLADQRKQNLVREEATTQRLTGTLASLGHMVNNSLTILNANIDEFERLSVGLSDEAKEQRAQSIAEMRSQYRVMVEAMKAMIHLSNVVYKNVSTLAETSSGQTPMAEITTS